jgi:uncharacterized glyoxalase superfamily protein PhnB
VNPAAQNQVYPALLYHDAPAAIAWLTRGFGFEVLSSFPGPNGTIAHAELKAGGGIIMVSSAQPEKGWKSPRDLGGVNQLLYLVVENPDDHYARAKAAGAIITQELVNQDYGSREYGCTDPEGHSWSFGTYLPGAQP